MEKWHNWTPEEVWKRLQSRKEGLSDEQARQRLAEYGPNELRTKGRVPWPLVFLRQFASPLIYILLAAAAIELLVLRKPTDAAVIMAVVVINALIGFIQEHKAERAMEALAAPQFMRFAPRLVPLVQGDNTLLAIKAIETLGHMGGQAAFRTLLAALGNADPDIQAAAERALDALNTGTEVGV